MAPPALSSYDGSEQREMNGNGDNNDHLGNSDSDSPMYTANGDGGASWLDEQLFDEDGDTTIVEQPSIWQKFLSPPERLNPVAPRSDPHENPVATIWNRVVGRLRYLILLLVFCGLWPMGLLSFRSFTNNTDSTFHPVPGSLSADAEKAFAKAYPHDWQDPMSPALFVVMEANESMTEEGSPVYKQARNFTYSLMDALNQTCWSPPDCRTDPEIRVNSYYSYAEEMLSWAAKGMATSDGKIIFLQVEYLFQPSVNSLDKRIVVSDMMTFIEQFGSQRPDPSAFNVSYTGIKWFQTDLVAATKQDLRRMDFVVAPLTLLLMGVVLPKARCAYVWIVPLITMISTVCCWSLIMRTIVHHIQITQFTPSIMMSLTLGMGIDYSLFLLSRYVEDTTDKNRAIRLTVQHGGNVVLLSGLTLMCTFLGLCFLPLQMLKSVGIGAAIAIGSSLAVNMTIVPALLHTGIGDLIVQKDDEQSPEHEPIPQIDPDANDTENNAGADDSGHGNENSENAIVSPVPTDSFWYRLSKQLLHPYKSIIILLAVSQLIVPVALNVGRIKTSISFDLLLPTNSPSLALSKVLVNQLGSGALAPYRILFDGHDANITMDSVDGFNVMHRVFDELVGIGLPLGENGSTLFGPTDNETKEFTNVLMDELHINSMIKAQRNRYKKNNRTNTETNTKEGNTSMLDKNSHVAINTGATKVDLGSNNVSESRAAKQDDTNKQDDVATRMSALPAKLESATSKTTQFSGIAVLRNVRIPHELYETAMECHRIKPQCPVEVFRFIELVDERSTAQDRYATYVTATLAVDPFSDEGVQWLEDARATIDRLAKDQLLQGVNIYIQGSASIAHEAVQEVMGAFPTVIAITLLLVFLLMGGFFQSIVPPLRSVISISFTLAFVFGLGVLVFEDGILGWTHISIFENSSPEVCWLVPVMAFSIMVGLALDYDVFLVSRILEFRREEGYGHKSSIVAGLHATGGIITAAGLIMALAFGGLMLSASPVLYQWSFLITSAVLLDTFVIRSLVVPIVTGWTGSWSWWPRQLPPPRVIIPGFEEGAVHGNGNDNADNNNEGDRAVGLASPDQE